MADEKKSLWHFIAHILEFAIIVVLAVIVIDMKLDRARRVVAATERAQKWDSLAVESAVQLKLYGELLKVVRTKEGLDSLANTTKKPKR